MLLTWYDVGTECLTFDVLDVQQEVHRIEMCKFPLQELVTGARHVVIIESLHVCTYPVRHLQMRHLWMPELRFLK